MRDVKTREIEQTISSFFFLSWLNRLCLKLFTFIFLLLVSYILFQFHTEKKKKKKQNSTCNEKLERGKENAKNLRLYHTTSFRKFLPFSQTLLLPLRHRPFTCEPQFLSFRDSSFLVPRTFPLLLSRRSTHTLERAVFRLFHPPSAPSVPFHPRRGDRGAELDK